VLSQQSQVSLTELGSLKGDSCPTSKVKVNDWVKNTLLSPDSRPQYFEANEGDNDNVDECDSFLWKSCGTLWAGTIRREEGKEERVCPH
jgi:hypothetical protein